MVSILIVPLVLSWVDDPPHLYVSPYSCCLNSHQSGLLNFAYSNWRTFLGHSSKEPCGQIITVMIPVLPNFFISYFSCSHDTIPEESSLRKRERFFFWLTVLSEGMVHHGRRTWDSCSHHIHSQQAENNKGFYLASFLLWMHTTTPAYFGDSFYHS